MREAEIRKRIWQIVREEIQECTISFIHHTVPKDYDFKKTLAEHFTDRIKKRVDALLDRHEAILVYQP